MENNVEENTVKENNGAALDRADRQTEADPPASSDRNRFQPVRNKTNEVLPATDRARLSHSLINIMLPAGEL
ncbi:MAG: hypothetical protein MI864_02420 [Pseudomonadales bacterium]|nr:hypothetical protein [Pseudomonadales bacterium]